jgi:hypothetical protein
MTSSVSSPAAHSIDRIDDVIGRVRLCGRAAMEDVAHDHVVADAPPDNCYRKETLQPFSITLDP